MSASRKGFQTARRWRWLALSAGLHLLLGGAAQLGRQALPRPGELPVIAVELQDPPQLGFVALRQAVRPRQQAAWGKPQQRVRFGAAASLAPARNPGAGQQAAARATREEVVGAQRDQLRSRLQNHRLLDRPLAPAVALTARRPQPQLVSPEPTPFRQDTQAAGSEPPGAAAAGQSPHTEADQVLRQAAAPLLEAAVGPFRAAATSARDQREQLARRGGRQAVAVQRPRWSPEGSAASRAAAIAHQLRAASTRRVPDVIDLARSVDSGKQQGAGKGAQAGRQGSAAGSSGPPLWLSTRDTRYLRYFSAIYDKVNPLWTFPKRLEVLLEQGDVIVYFTIHADGSVSDLQVRKSSGFSQFDRNVLAAIERAAPFAPVPPGLGAPLRVLAPFEFANPMVR